MNKDHLRFLLSGILFGFLVGYVVAYALYEPHVKQVADPVPEAGNMGMSAGGPPAAASAAGAPPAGGGAPGQPTQMMEEVFRQVSALKEALEKNPRDESALVRLANFYQDAGKFDQAVTFYKRALEVRPSNSDARTDMGICLREMGRPDEAIAAFKKSIETDPRHWQSWLNLGIVSLFDKHDPAAAEAAFGKVEEINPAYSELPSLKEAVRRARGAAS